MVTERITTYCPQCGREDIPVEPGGSNSYDWRQKLLTPHNTPSGERCPETTTLQDALAFWRRHKKEGMLSSWKFLSPLRIGIKRSL